MKSSNDVSHLVQSFRPTPCFRLTLRLFFIRGSISFHFNHLPPGLVLQLQSVAHHGIRINANERKSFCFAFEPKCRPHKFSLGRIT